MKFLYQKSSLIKSSDLETFAKKITPYIENLNDVVASEDYDSLESSINLPADKKLLENVLALSKKKDTSELKYIIDIGIGGSNLGTKAVYDALFGYFEVLQPKRFPKMIFLDTTDEDFLTKFSTFINTLESKNQVVVNAISKSGGTTETIANLEITLSLLEKKFGDIKDRVVITTDENSKLWNVAVGKGYDVLGLPKQVGGRFSVLSAVGLFPLAMCGLDISSLLEGALQMRTQCLNKTVENNPAALSAIIMYIHSTQGKNINDTFIFVPHLESIGKWYRQLMGESLGKEHDLDGKVVHTGITPTVSIGSTDLHSVGQLYLGGPRDKVTTFVYKETSHEEISVRTDLQFPLVEGIQGKKISDIMKAIGEGVKVAYQKQELPYMEVAFDSINEKSIGEFFQFKMIEMMYLGKLLNVNTFDQPHVELYKIETKKILGS